MPRSITASTTSRGTASEEALPRWQTRPTSRCRAFNSASTSRAGEWFRGSSELLQRSVRSFVPVVEAIAAAGSPSDDGTSEDERVRGDRDPAPSLGTSGPALEELKG